MILFIHADGRVATVTTVTGRNYAVAVYASNDALQSSAGPLAVISLVGVPNRADILAALPGFTDQSDPALPAAPSPPPSVTAWQIRRWLIANGISLASVDAAINGITNPVLKEQTRVDWEYAPYIERTHPMLASLASALGINDIDLAFIEAETIS